jgi:hypothetical protein
VQRLQRKIKGFFMTEKECKAVDFIFKVTASAVFFVVGVALMLAYFDVLTK